MAPKRKISNSPDDDLPSHEQDDTNSEIRDSYALVVGGTTSATKRRKIKAGSANLPELGRKKYRLEKYYEEMAVLNRSFVSYCSDAKHKILYKLENGKEIHPQEDEDFTQEARQYIEHAAKIRKRWIPATGDVLSFGTNDFGQLAQANNVKERKRPSLIMTLRDRGVVEVACGGLHNVAVAEDGKVNTWGCNDEGSLGSLTADGTAYAPVNVSGFVPSSRETATGLQRPKYTWSDLRSSKGLHDFTDPTLDLDHKYEELIVSVAAGDCHCLALSETGRVYFFGAYKCTGGMRWSDVPPVDDPRVHSKEEENESKIIPPTGKRDWPIHVWQLGAEAIQIACSNSISAAVVKRTINGIERQQCFTWGLGENGELARPVFKPLKKSEEEFSKIPEEELAKNSYLTFHVDKVRDDYLKPGQALFADGNQDRIVEQVACGGFRKWK